MGAVALSCSPNGNGLVKMSGQVLFRAHVGKDEGWLGVGFVAAVHAAAACDVPVLRGFFKGEMKAAAFGIAGSPRSSNG